MLQTWEVITLIPFVILTIQKQRKSVQKHIHVLILTDVLCDLKERSYPHFPNPDSFYTLEKSQVTSAGVSSTVQ